RLSFGSSSRLLLLLLIFLFQLRNFLLHLLHVLLHGLHRSFEVVEFVGARRRTDSNSNEERNANDKRYSMSFSHNGSAVICGLSIELKSWNQWQHPGVIYFDLAA